MAAVPPQSDSCFLFGFDLEDVRTMIPHGERYAPRVRENTLPVLDFLDRHDARCTFFTVGNVARELPDLIAEIAARGHELACHTSEHTPLERLGPEGLRRDLERNIEDLQRAGAGEIQGFRAPVASLTAETAWAYEVLAELGFRYSSSVIPAPNPLYGWPEFGRECRTTDAGVFEIPLTTSHFPGLDVPYCGGVYFRVLPFPIVRWLYRRDAAARGYVTCHLHPYDFDIEQERFMHPELRGSGFYNRLMYMGRGSVMRRLERLMAREGARIVKYADYAERKTRASAAAA